MAEVTSTEIPVVPEVSENPVVVPEVPPPTVLEEVKESNVPGTHIGQVKWFNPKLGYGFITVVVGDDKGKDIFAHHSGIKPTNSNYKTLEKGEYIQFNVTNGQNGTQAVDITGIEGGPLMCDFVVKRPGMTNPAVPQPPRYPMGSHSAPPPPPQSPAHGKWQSVPRRGPAPRNKLKYSKEGRELMKSMKVR